MSVPLTVSSEPQHASRLSSRLDMASSSSVADLLEQLQAAISDGDEFQAQAIAAALARQKTKLKIESKAPTSQDKLVRVKIFVEDKLRTGSFIHMDLNPAMKFEDLKRKMLLEHGFPPEIQVWIVGQRIARDTETLDRREINRSGATMYLYLRSAESVGLTPHDFQMKYGHLFTAGGNYTPVTPGGQRQQTAGGSIAGRVPVTRLDEEETSPSRSPPRSSPSEESSRQVGWACPACTFINIPTRPGCEICSTDRPATYRVPKNIDLPPSEKKRLEQDAIYERMMKENLEQQRSVNFSNHVVTDGLEIVPNPDTFTCSICFDDISPGSGVVLRECLHTFCKDCLVGQIEYSATAQVKCPYQDDSYSCDAYIQDRDIRALCSDDLFERHLKRSLSCAETQITNSYHCKTPDCIGWCEYEAEVNKFECPVCGKENCVTCKAIHEGMNCGQYQDELHSRAKLDKNARKTLKAIQKLLSKGDALHCPRCNIILQKKDGCDWVLCSMCQLEICWVTKQARWGPNGTGDTSGGCRCRVDGQQCHPDCVNCH